MYNAMYTGRMTGAAGPPVELKFNCGFAWVGIRQLSVEKGIKDRDVSEKCLKELKVTEWRLNCLRYGHCESPFERNSKKLKGMFTKWKAREQQLRIYSQGVLLN